MRTKSGRLVVYGIVLCLLPLLVLWRMQRAAEKAASRVRAARSVAARCAELGPAAHGRLLPGFRRAGIAYPPAAVALVGLKRERVLEVWVRGNGAVYTMLRSYPILAASGKAGPKLREGDRQVPEGVYGVESLNPASRFHVALRVNYPNAFDRRMAQAEGRTRPGSDIMIHGGAASVGCLAMGDAAAEDLFVLAAETGIANVTVILCPRDFAAEPPGARDAGPPGWKMDLYREIARECGRIRNGERRP